MPQGISPNPLNKISEVYLSQISEHHKKDADGNTIPHEDELDEAKVDQGRSDYGKASIRNYRRMGPGHDEPGMFDPEGKRGKTIEKRREEHKARRGVKGAKVPAYKVEEVEVDEAMAMKPSNMKKKAKLNAALKRLEDMKVASKMKEEVQIDEGSPAWQRKEGKSESGGLNAKGVASYRAANPGSKLKTAVTTKPSKLKKGSKAANRRKSYCARSAGQMKKFPKAAKDPNSRLRQARRRWNC